MITAANTALGVGTGNPSQQLNTEHHFAHLLPGDWVPRGTQAHVRVPAFKYNWEYVLILDI